MVNLRNVSIWAVWSLLMDTVKKHPEQNSFGEESIYGYKATLLELFK